ncbi:hypothetical protein EV659_103237 [Rhodothalassium salexigens DSM 2132]|uniref:HK97 gp10 family phage protein n=1 Tax=Rhodothalassium salexigens DSM 2132 TaxID=1188247 RepID=A0A4R2PLK8_RHOSA|nr:hypothetical protein [Rhodothalassium salexigens]MBB4210995.1 hypothetical protein [Rhodothalassium salexigens DSM 2132]MBK1638726.1 hypothetical protein [Rhodothalassium salexigens DSM 2132]TCP36347.1 hypothetical protein EV659_103237 [Rhodothalassium salexigens DSM 2132]
MTAPLDALQSRRQAQARAGLTPALSAVLARLSRAVARDARARVRANRAPDRPGPSILAGSIDAGPTRDPLAWTVAAGAAHAVFVEFGTARQGADPFLSPAVEQAASQGLRPVVAARADSGRTRHGTVAEPPR